MTIEFLGICASIIILAGFFSSKEKVIRISNIIGSACFLVYGAILSAYSLIILNALMIVLHIVKMIIKSTRKKEKN